MKIRDKFLKDLSKMSNEEIAEIIKFRNCLYCPAFEECEKEYEGDCKRFFKLALDKEEPYPYEKGELCEVSNDGQLWYLRRFSYVDEEGEYHFYAYGYSKKYGDGTIVPKYHQKYGTLGKE